ncbi:MAG: hypothetical protein KGM47_07325 [Acidobacteriota bacterium]|nr:hypothetical protein [Acidobacteriota bacterium]
MLGSIMPRCSKTAWQGREAYALENDLIRLVLLVSGGHVAAFQFHKAAGRPEINPLWTPPWKSIDHDRYNEKRHQAVYGPAATGKLLCGIAGHNICLDYFGPPSDEEAQHGLAIHGEAPNSRWQVEECGADGRESFLRASVGLPVAGLRFEREIRLRQGEPVAYFRETVTNERNADHFFHWTQHVTLGPPFLNLKESRVAVSATRGRTFPHGYEGRELLKSSRDFRWPLAPGAAGKTVDLTLPFQRPGLGFLATALMNPRREWQFIAAINRRYGLLVGYYFARADFPWTAIWEEDKSRPDAPWRNRCQARGLEFGSTPFPLLRREAFSNGPLFGTPHFSLVPARGQKTVRYMSFLASVPADFGNVEDVRVSKGAIRIKGSKRGASQTLAASCAPEL